MSKYLNPFPQHFNAESSNAFYKVYFGEPNQDTKTNLKVIYSDEALSVPLANPQTLNSSGAYAQDIFLNGLYSIRIETPLGSLWREAPEIAQNTDASGISYLSGEAGAVSTTVEDRLQQLVFLNDFLTTAQKADIFNRTGALDIAGPLENAINSLGNAKSPCVILPSGLINVERPLVLIVDRYKMMGQRSERGANAANANIDYDQTTIQYRPSTATDYFISKFSTAASLSSNIGPFEHENILFDLAGNNGFQFGNADLNDDGTRETIQDGVGQRYVFGARFTNCGLDADAADRASVNGVITRTGQVMVYLTKGFESVFEDCSLFGSDWQVRAWGCDKPVFIRCRSQGSHVPLMLEGSGTFTVQHTVEDLQVEGWTFGPIMSLGCTFTGSNIRLEKSSSEVGEGRYDLTSALSITASVTADSNAMTFSATVDDILFPDLSIIEISDGTNTDSVLVSSVNGTAVTFHDTAFTLTWADAAANVTRIHGYGPLHFSQFDGAYSGVSVNQASDTPPFVYGVNRGQMSITNGQQQAGVNTQRESLVIGNHLVANQYLNAAMMFSGCTPNVVADANHPYVHVDGWQAARGGNTYYSTERSHLGDLFENINTVKRSWSFTPKNSGQASSNSYLHPIVELDGDAETEQKIWAWHKRDGSGILLLTDFALPSVSAQYIRVRFKVQGVSGTPDFKWQFRGAAASANETVVLSTAWEIIEIIRPMPSIWSGVKTTDFGFGISSTAGQEFYLAGVTVDEIGVDDYSDAIQTFASGDLTPSVAGYKKFKTGSNISITDFDNGVVGQTIEILAEHTATINDNAAIILNGGANYVMGASDTLRLTMFNDQIWHETSRSVN